MAHIATQVDAEIIDDGTTVKDARCSLDSKSARLSCCFFFLSSTCSHWQSSSQDESCCPLQVLPGGGRTASYAAGSQLANITRVSQLTITVEHSCMMCSPVCYRHGGLVAKASAS